MPSFYPPAQAVLAAPFDGASHPVPTRDRAPAGKRTTERTLQAVKPRPEPCDFKTHAPGLYVRGVRGAVHDPPAMRNSVRR
jgi:hypothetical protein